MSIRLYNDTGSQTDAIRLYSDREPLAPTPYSPSLLEQTFSQSMESAQELGADPLSLKADPKKALGNAWNSIKDSVLAERERLGKLFGPEYQKEDVAGKIALSTEALAGGAGVVLSPISALFSGAEEIPVLGTLSKLISLPFSVAGEAGSKVGEEVIDKLPISKESKDKLKPGIQEIFSLAAQIALGKATEVGGKKMSELTKKYGAEDAQTILSKANQLATEQKAQTPSEAPSAGIRLYPEAPQTLKTAPESMGVSKLEEISATGEVKTRGLSIGIEQKAIENKLTKGFGDLPEYQTVNMAEQARLAKELIEKDYDTARRVAMGQESAPQGIIPEMLLKVVEDKAIKVGDVTTIRELGTQSGLLSEATTMGQRIRALAERDSESPVSAIIEVKKARMERLKESIKATQKTKAEIREEIKKTKPTKETWDKFVDSLIC